MCSHTQWWVSQPAVAYTVTAMYPNYCTPRYAPSHQQSVYLYKLEEVSSPDRFSSPRWGKYGLGTLAMIFWASFRIRDLAKLPFAAVSEIHKVAEHQPISYKTSNYSTPVGCFITFVMQVFNYHFQIMPIRLRKAQEIVPKVPRPYFPCVFRRGEENRSGDETICHQQSFYLYKL